MQRVEHHNPSFGYNSFEGFVEEDCVQALDQRIADRLGIAEDPRQRWRRCDDGMHVLAMALYQLLKRGGLSPRGRVVPRFPGSRGCGAQTGARTGRRAVRGTGRSFGRPLTVGRVPPEHDNSRTQRSAYRRQFDKRSKMAHAFIRRRVAVTRRPHIHVVRTSVMFGGES